MPNKKQSKSKFEKFAMATAKASGSSWSFIIALSVVIIWLTTGPIFQYSDTWQLVINTGTTIITFLMVFLIQKSQNLDSLAFKLKLNELIASQKYASNRLLDVEDLSETEMETLFKFYVVLSKKAERDLSLHESHSIEEAEFLHKVKTKNKKKNSIGLSEDESKKSESKPFQKKRPVQANSNTKKGGHQDSSPKKKEEKPSK